MAPEVATRKANVSTHWEADGDDIDAQSEFIKQIVERVNVEGDQVMAMTVLFNCHLVLGYHVN